jgi:SAM-dependent methyltransferase
MKKVHSVRRRWKSVVCGMIRWSAWFLGQALPLSTRRALVASVGRRKPRGGFEFAMGMLNDLRRRDPVSLHRFLWANHLAYAESYEVSKRFGTRNINPTRLLLFDNITTHLRSRGLDPRKDIHSVFEIGCSMGYLLRHLEEEVFPSASILNGLDIDAYAVQAGSAYLSSLGSRVKLFSADMESAERIMGRQSYDLVLCCGVLMYVNESTAQKVVRAMLSRAAHLVGVICLAPPGGDLERSQVRRSDGAFIHKMDRLIHRAGGRVVSSNWIGASASVRSSCHVILAEPPLPARRGPSVSSPACRPHIKTIGGV